jgi:hypothetical protein
MKKLIHGAGFSLLLIWPCLQVSAQDKWTSEQQEVLASIEQLSATTAPGGKGADGYGLVLSDRFSRWTTGSSVITGKQAWVEGVREWFDDGWRVSDRNQTILDISVNGEFAFTRRIVEETYLGPDGETTKSRAGLAETWIRVDSAWLLFRVNVDVLD